MVRNIFLLALSLAITEQAFSAACQGRWSYTEWNTCRHPSNGIDTPAIVIEDSSYEQTSVRYERRNLRLVKPLTAIQFNDPTRYYASYNERCRKALENWKSDYKPKGDYTKVTDEIIDSSIEAFGAYERDKQIRRNIDGSRRSTTYFIDFQCRFQTRVTIENTKIIKVKGKKLADEVYFNEPNRLCGIEKKQTALGYDNESLLAPFPLAKNRGEKQYRFDFTCSTGEHLAENTPKQVVDKALFLLGQYRKSGVEVSTFEKEIIANELLRFSLDYADILEDEQALFDMIENIDFESADVADALKSTFLVTYNWLSTFMKLFVWDFDSDTAIVDRDMELADINGITHKDVFGVNASETAIYFHNEFYKNITKKTISDGKETTPIRLPYNGGYYSRGIYTNEDETLLVSHLRITNAGEFELIELYDLVSGNKLETIQKLDLPPGESFSWFFSNGYVTGFNRSSNQLLMARGKKLQFYDIEMGAVLNEVTLENNANRIHVSPEGNYVAVITNENRQSAIEVFDSFTGERIDSFQVSGGIPQVSFVGRPQTVTSPADDEDMGMGEDEVIIEEDMGMDETPETNDDSVGMGDDEPYYLLYSSGKNLPGKVVTTLNRRNILAQTDDGLIDVGYEINYIFSMDISPDQKYLLISSWDIPPGGSTTVRHTRLIEVDAFDPMSIPVIRKDVQSEKFTTNAYFISRAVDENVDAAIEIGEIMAQNASNQPIPKKQPRKSLAELGIEIRTGQPMTGAIEDAIAQHSLEIDQNCTWASLPFRYQFVDGVAYVNSSRTRVNVFTYDRVISEGCEVENMTLADGSKIFDKVITGVGILGHSERKSDFVMTEELETLVSKHGVQVTMDCRFAARPYIYRFEDAYLFVTSSRTKARIYNTADVPSECVANEKTYY